MRSAQTTISVLVTDGNSRAALAVTRSLGQAGYRVVVGEKASTSLAGASRFCAARFTYPDPTTDEVGFLRVTADAVHRHDVKALLPMTDIATWVIVAHRDRFEPRCRIPCAALPVLERAADKAAVVQTAMRIGVPVPKTVFLDRPDLLALVAPELVYPVVVKPRRSRVRAEGQWQSTTVRYAETDQALAREVASRRPEDFPLLLQEKIVGPGVGVFTCFDQQGPMAWFGHRRLREKPPSGGVSVLCESAPVPEDTRAHAERLLREIGWHGVAMVEFKQDERDGIPKLMEINGRFWGSLQLAVDAGVDFPLLLLETALGSTRRVLPTYRVGVRSRWLWGDVDALLIALRTGRGQDGRGRGRAIADFLTTRGDALHYENPRRADLGPWWFETRQRLRSLVC